MKYKSSEINKLDNFIMGWYMPKKLCSDIFGNLIKKQNKLRNANEETSTNFRNYYYTGDEDANKFVPEKKLNNYFFHLKNLFDLYKKTYVYSDQVASYFLQSFKLQLYLPNNSYNAWHSELETVNPQLGVRHLVFMTYLNSVDEENCGGGTEFFYQKLKIKPEAGLTLIWPVAWTHVHRGIPSLKNYKGIVTGWMFFPPNNSTC